MRCILCPMADAQDVEKHEWSKEMDFDFQPKEGMLLEFCNNTYKFLVVNVRYDGCGKRLWLDGLILFSFGNEDIDNIDFFKGDGWHFGV